MADVFLSHSSQDSEVASRVCTALERAGIRVWIAPRDIGAGEDWGASIISAIGKCRLMMLLFTTRSNVSPQVSREAERAVAKGVPIIPLRLENVMPSGSLEYFLGTTQWLDAFGKHLDEFLPDIVKAAEDALRGNVPLRAPAISPKVPEPVQRRIGRWMVTGVIIVVILAVAWYITVYPKDREIDIALDLQRQFAAARQSMLQTGKVNATPVSNDIKRLFKLNPESGYALYYRGELERLMHQSVFTPKDCLKRTPAATSADLSLYENDFYRYLDNASHLPASQTGGNTGAAICYARPLGYCPQRTAWVNHLLAIDLYYKALSTSDPDVRRSQLISALGHAHTALKLYPPQGFDQCVPTTVLVEKLSAALHRQG